MTQACCSQAQISFFFYKQGTPEHESNEMVVCHACMADKTDDDNIAPHSIADSFVKLAGTLSGTLALLGFFLLFDKTTNVKIYFSHIWKQFLTRWKVLHVFISEDRLELLI